MNEYSLENGHAIDLEPLQVGHVERETYKAAHETMCFACHDVLVRMDGKYLLIQRDNVPAKGILWPLGGRISRGVPVEDSLKNKVLQESGLKLTNVVFLGTARTMFETEPFGHGKGTDTVCLMYVADGEGEVKLDSLHSLPTWLTEAEYREAMRDKLHPYVVEMFDKAISVV